jgi:hypothetical protein
MQNEVSEVVKPKRKLCNDDILKYEPLVEKFIRDSCIKNWSESRTSPHDSFLGNSGFSLNDIRQHLRTEICVALQNYNPEFRAANGRSVKESTFVYQHLTFRVGQMMKRLTKRRLGYGIRHNHIDLVMQSGSGEAGVEMDMVLSLDQKNAVAASRSMDREQFIVLKRFSKDY